MAIPRADPLQPDPPDREFPARGIHSVKQVEGSASPHAAQHKIEGNDSLVPSDIGAADRNHTHPLTRDLFIYPSQDAHDAILDDWPHNTAGAANEVAFIWRVPADGSAINSISIVMIPDATETIQADIDVSVAAVGEDYNADTRQALDGTLDVTVDDITEWDISAVGSLFDGIEGGDYIAIRFESDTDTLRILGLRINYEA